MPSYKAPLRDMRFVINDLLDMPGHYARLPNMEEASADIVDAILEQGARFAETELAPLNQVGDREGCTLKEGEVSTPTGFKAAYQSFVAGGWPSLAHDEELGGQGLPESLGIILNEMLGSANWAWAMYPGLSHGAMNTLHAHGTPEQQQQYLVPLISGQWTGTMCLTEAHCGSDLGLLKTKAVPQEDGSYAITGSKMFISAGEHDLADNIVHIVLARLPDAPAGTKGISLFIVPKFNLNDDGSLGERNGVSCGSLEHKMGIHGNATCLLNFDGAKGYLIGPANKGLNCMFTFMNMARLGTAMQGLAHAEFALQNSVAYARERLQFRALSGTKAPDKVADPIIVHPDVRRMLLTQKAFAEGGRMLLYYAAQQVDVVRYSEDADAVKAADQLLSLLTPIAKAFMTETGFEAANLGMQVFGGHGYIREWGMEQNVRDSRIATLYEGTTGIQALDLLGRKVLMTQGETLKAFTKIIHKYCQSQADNAEMVAFIEPLQALNSEWGELTMQIGMAALENPEEVGAASVDYLLYSGYVVYAYLWARAAEVAMPKASEAEFYQTKVATADFYYKRILPRTRALAVTMVAGVACLMQVSEDQFCAD